MCGGVRECVSAGCVWCVECVQVTKRFSELDEVDCRETAESHDGNRHYSGPGHALWYSSNILGSKNLGNFLKTMYGSLSLN